MKDFKKFSMYEDHETTASDSTNAYDEGREEKPDEVTFRQYLKESDPEVQEWLKNISEDHYDFISRYWKEMRAYGGTKAKMIFHRALKVYCDEQLAKERELRKELVEWGEVLLRNTRFVGIFPDSSIKLEALIKKGT